MSFLVDLLKYWRFLRLRCLAIDVVILSKGQVSIVRSLQRKEVLSFILLFENFIDCKIRSVPRENSITGDPQIVVSTILNSDWVTTQIFNRYPVLKWLWSLSLLYFSLSFTNISLMVRAEQRIPISGRSQLVHIETPNLIKVGKAFFDEIWCVFHPWAYLRVDL